MSLLHGIRTRRRMLGLAVSSLGAAFVGACVKSADVRPGRVTIDTGNNRGRRSNYGDDDDDDGGD